MTDFSTASPRVRLLSITLVTLVVLSPLVAPLGIGPIGTAAANTGVHYVTDSGFEIEDTSGGAVPRSGNPYPDADTLDLPGITLSASGDAYVTLEQRNGTFTNLTNVDDAPSILVTPEDKQEIALMGGFDTLNFSDATYASADSDADIVYSASSTATLRLESTGLSTGTTVNAVDVDSDSTLDSASVSSNGSVTFSSLDAGDHAANLKTPAAAPSITSFSVTNPSSQDVTVSFDSDTQLSTISATISGAESATLTEGDFSESGSGPYTYEATYSGSSDGTYDVTLDTAEDSAGNDGAGGESETVTVDTTAPAISSFDVTNPSGQDVNVTFESNETLSNISVSISGAETATLTESDFAETDNGGNYSYNATYAGSTDGDYTATLNTAEDDAGNDGASGESETVTVDTTAPAISSFDGSNPSGQDVTVSLDSDEQLSTITVSVSGAESATLSTGEFSETDNGGSYTYDATYSGSSDGTYDVTLDTAEDSARNDGASGETDSVSISTDDGGGDDGDNGEDDTSGDGDDDSTDDGGDDSTDDETDTTAPTASASGPSSATVDTSVEFDGTGSSDNRGIASYEWDFGDGASGSGPSPEHTYYSTGEYTVTLTVTDEAGNTDTDSVTLTVEADSDGDGIADSQEGDGDTDGDGVPDFEDSDTDGDGIPDREEGGADVDGDGVPNYKDTDANGDGVPDSESGTTDSDGDGIPDYRDTVDNSAALIPRIEASSYVVAENASITFSASESTIPDGAAATFEWDVDSDGSVDATGVTTNATFADAGQHEVTLTVSAANETATTTTAIRVRDGTRQSADDGQDVDNESATAAISHGTLNFGAVEVGESVTRQVTVSNPTESSVPLAVDNTVITGKDPDAFTTSADATPFTLAPGEARAIDVVYAPTEVGTNDAQLQVHTNASGQQQTNVWLSSSRAYVIVEETDPDPEIDDSANAPAVTVDANNIQPESDLVVNVSQPGTNEAPAGFDQLAMTVENGGFFEMNLTYTENAPDGHAEYEDEQNKSLQYVQLDHSVPNNEFDNTSITYRVRKDTLPANTTPAEVTFERFADGTWDTLSASHQQSTGTHHIYSVATPGFSQFAITAPTAGAPDNGTDGTDGTTLPGDGETDEQVDDGGDETADDDDDDGSLPVLSIGLGLAVLVGLAGFVFLWRRRDD